MASRRALVLLLAASAAAADGPPGGNASSWWFVAPAPDDAVTLRTGADGSLVLGSGVLSFRFARNDSDILLSSVMRSRCPDADCDGGAVFSFPGTYTQDCNQVNCSAARPVPEPHAAMATVQLDHRQFYLGHPSSPVPAEQRWAYDGHRFVPATTKRFHWVPGRKGGEDTPWPPAGGALTLSFSLPCSRLPTPVRGTMRATLTYELYAGTPFFVKRMNISNGCDAPVFISDKLFEQPSTNRQQSYSQYITYAHAPAFSFAPGAVYEAPYTLGDFSAPMNDEVKTLPPPFLSPFWHQILAARCTPSRSGTGSAFVK